jgi:DNA polymerase I-like protein with 3'-5' exonuclease and polymerase domains
MLRLPLYREPPRAAVESVAPVVMPSDGCHLLNCARWEGCGGQKKLESVDPDLTEEAGQTREVVGRPARPIRPAPRAVVRLGEHATVAAITGAPTRSGGAAAWSSALEQEVMGVVEAHADGVVYDHASRCPGEADASLCVGYLTTTLRAHPNLQKVLLFGAEAQRAYLGWSLPWPKVRGGAFVQRDGTEVWCLPDLSPMVWRNSILARWAVADVERALTTKAVAPPWDAEVQVIETEEDAIAAATTVLSAFRHANDVETFGRVGDPQWCIVSGAVAPVDGSDTVFVWPEDALRPDDPRSRQYARVVSARGYVGHNGKFDVRANVTYLGASADPGPNGVAGDTQVAGKVENTEASGYLGEVSATVGMAGHKDEMEALLEEQKPILRRLRRAATLEVVSEWETLETFTKTGRISRRKVPKTKRPPTPAEAAALVGWAWNNPGVALQQAKVDVMIGAGLRAPAKWELAALSDGDIAWYLHGLAAETREGAEVVWRYNAADVLATVRVDLRQNDTRDTSVGRQRRRLLWSDHLRKAPWAVGRVEAAGLRLDLEARAKLEAELDSELGSALDRIHAVAPDLNPGSSQQLGQLLYGRDKGCLRLPIRARTESGAPATDKVTLKALAKDHPVVADILTYKELEKLQGTYVRGLLEHLRSDGRVRCSLNLTGTGSGRMSCSDPNLQTMPTRGKRSKQIKGLFIPADGYRFLQADYKTLEVVIAAMLSGDPMLLSVFLRDPPGDPHRELAISVSEIIWGNDFETCGGLPGLPMTAEGGEDTPLGAEQKKRRHACKTVLFGALYGQGPQSLAEQLGIPLPQAERIHGIVLGQLAGFQAWVRAVEQEAARTGLTWTWWNGEHARCRTVPDVGSPDRGIMGHGRRAAMNTRIQGTGHEFCLASLVTVEERFWSSGMRSRIVMPVHDSLLVEAPEDEVEEAANIMTEVMTGWPTARGLTLRIDLEQGTSWGNLGKMAA